MNDTYRQIFSKKTEHLSDKMHCPDQIDFLC